MRRVLFIPNYAYLNMPIFNTVIARLRGKIVSAVVDLPGGSVLPSSGNVPKADGNGGGWLTVRLWEYPRNDFVGCLRSVIAIWRNYLEIGRFVAREKPDVVVVGSDLGNLNIRFILEHCMLQKISIIILYSCDVPAGEMAPVDRFMTRLLFRSHLNVLRFLRALLFRGNIVGHFALGSHIFVISADTRRKLVAKGIGDDRITIISFPQEVNEDSSVTKIVEQLGIAAEHQIVTFFTECIQSVYGEEYAASLYKNMAALFHSMAQDGVVFLIKPHPREPQSMLDYLANVFSVSPCRVVSTFTAEDLIRVSAVSLAHYSRVLITACQLRRQFLSLNLRGDRERTFIPAELAAVLEVGSCSELGTKLADILASGPLADAVSRSVAALADRYVCCAGDDKLFAMLAG